VLYNFRLRNSSIKLLSHTTAKASHYNAQAKYYDEFNENNSQATKVILEQILKEHHVSDLATVFRTKSYAIFRTCSYSAGDK
jgi:hypothetical protein